MPKKKQQTNIIDSLEGLELKITQLTKELKTANTTIELLKNEEEKTISFQVGKAFLESTKSVKGLINLPFKLRKIHVNANNRKTDKKNFTSTLAKDISKYRDTKNEKALSILDEMSNLSWAPEFQLFPINRKDFQNQIKTSKSSFAFIESCWRGNDGAWEYAFTSPGLKHQNAQDLLKVIEQLKQRNIPIVFWNKEDPMHYDRFLPIAKHADYILTTDEKKLEDYKTDVPTAKTNVLPFAAQQILCNPCGRFQKETETICFAGSYYSQNHEERKNQMDALLPVIPKFNGVIYDRMSKLNDEKYAYPEMYQPFIRDAVPFSEITDVYKQFKIFLNVNTIIDSPTMMARRVYELLACGTPVISTPSLAIENEFKGIVKIASDADEAYKIAEELLNDKWKWLETSHIGYREVMLKHTYKQRSNTILKQIGKTENIVSQPFVSIITATKRPEFIERFTNNIKCQVHKNLEVIIITQSYTDEDVKNLRNELKDIPTAKLQIIENNTKDTLGERLNIGVSLSKGEYIAKMDDDDFYYKNYLQDMLIPFSYGDYGMVGKREIFVYLEGSDKTIVRYSGERHQNTSFVAGPTFVMKKSIFEKVSFKNVNQGEDSNLLDALNKEGIKIYAADPFGFVQWRSSQQYHHTWKATDDFFLKEGEHLSNGIPEDVIDI